MNVDAELAALVSEANVATAADTAARRRAPSYQTAHSRLRSDRGVASVHDCVDCNGPAAHWSFAHERASQRLTDPRHPGSLFSLDPADYDPRCVRCHARYDMANGKSSGRRWAPSWSRSRQNGRL